MIATHLESPCIGICSTVYGDDVCRGCKRHYLEVINWNGYLDAQKKSINLRLESQIEMVASKFIEITHQDRLKSQLDQVALRPPIYNSPLYWGYELLRLKAKEINDLTVFGLRAQPAYEALSANELFTQIDDELYRFTSNSHRPLENLK